MGRAGCCVEPGEGIREAGNHPGRGEGRGREGGKRRTLAEEGGVAPQRGGGRLLGTAELLVLAEVPASGP